MNPFATLLGLDERKVADASALTFEAIFGAPTSKTGASVNVDTALRTSTVLACVRVIADGIAQVPLKLYREEKSGAKNLAWDHPLHWILSRRPNAWQTSFEWRESSMFHACLSQGSFAVINRVGGKVDELIPLMPSTVATTWKQGAVSYRVSDQKGIVGDFAAGEVFALKGPSWNTVNALDMVRQAAEAIGLAIAIEESQARLHANGARPSGVLSSPNALSPEARARLAKLFEDGFQGLMNAGKVPILDNGMKFESASMTGADAQTLESRKHQIEEIARVWRVHPQMIGHGDKAPTYASAEQFFTAHVVHCLGPWYERWEQAITRDLLTPKEVRDGYFVKFSVAGLLRGDATSRANYYKAALGTASSPGWMSPNDVRRLEDMDPGEEDLDQVISAEDMSGAGGAPDPEAVAEGSEPPADGVAPGVSAVQDTALNGAQVASLLAIVQAVAAGQLPPATARAMIAASFPNVPATTIDAMLAGMKGWEPEEPEDTTEPPDPADDPEEDATEGEGMKAMGESLERGLVALAGGLAAKSGRAPELVFTRDATGAVIGAKIQE